jgi:hypothetical protein
MAQSGALLERMASSGADIVSLDWTVTVPEARKRIGDDIGIQVRWHDALAHVHVVCKAFCHCRYA